MTHDMREDIRHYLESMSDDFKVGGLLNKKEEKARGTRSTFTECCFKTSRQS